MNESCDKSVGCDAGTVTGDDDVTLFKHILGDNGGRGEMGRDTGTAIHAGFVAAAVSVVLDDDEDTDNIPGNDDVP